MLTLDEYDLPCLVIPRRNDEESAFLHAQKQIPHSVRNDKAEPVLTIPEILLQVTGYRLQFGTPP